MQSDDIKKALQEIVRRLPGKKFNWRLEGSANLLLQGVDTSVRDLDITTDDEGIEIFRHIMKDSIVSDTYDHKKYTLLSYFNGFEVDINSCGDTNLGKFDKTVIYDNIPILPLKYAREVYQELGRKEKVELIDNYFR